jgi:small subunit ribosomal protein S6
MARKKEEKPILYEMMYILDPELGEDGIARMNEALRDRITGAEGAIEKETPWGIRRLAYEVKKRQEGYYNVIEFRAPSNLPGVIESFIRTQIGILRYLIIRVPKARLLQEQRDAAQRKAAAEKAAAGQKPPVESPETSDREIFPRHRPVDESFVEEENQSVDSESEEPGPGDINDTRSLGAESPVGGFDSTPAEPMEESAPDPDESESVEPKSSDD